jgi:hypothetical protein
LVPKKAREFLKSTAEEVNLSEDLVSKLTGFYWQNVRKNITELNYKNLSIINLGNFKVKHWKIDETVEGYTRTIESLDGKFTRYNLKKDLEERIEKLNRIKSLVQEETDKFKEIRENRNDKKSKKNMGQQSSDMGRLQEPGIQD